MGLLQQVGRGAEKALLRVVGGIHLVYKDEITTMTGEHIDGDEETMFLKRRIEYGFPFRRVTVHHRDREEHFQEITDEQHVGEDIVVWKK